MKSYSCAFLSEYAFELIIVAFGLATAMQLCCSKISQRVLFMNAWVNGIDFNSFCILGDVSTF